MSPGTEPTFEVSAAGFFLIEVEQPRFEWFET